MAEQVVNITVRPADGFSAGTIQEEVAEDIYVTRDRVTGAVLSVQVAAPRIVRINGTIIWASAEQHERWSDA